MQKLTMMQKILRPIINHLVETYFPNGIFYGDSDALNEFEKFDVEGGNTIGRAAAFMLVRKLIDEDNTSITVEIEGLTINGEMTGDWLVLVSKINNGDTP